MQLLCAALSRTARSGSQGRRVEKKDLTPAKTLFFLVLPLEEHSSVMEADSEVDV